MQIQMVVALFNNEFPEDKRYSIALNIYRISLIIIIVMAVYTKKIK